MWTHCWMAPWKQPEIRKKFLENASRNIDRLVNLMNDLDEISKLESGEQLLYKQNFIIQELIKEIFESLSIKLEKKQITSCHKKRMRGTLLWFLPTRKK